MEGNAPDTKLRKRAGIICIVMSVLFLALSLRILFYQTFQYDEFEDKVLEQITQETTVTADRGNIYDTNGVVIATNITTYRLFLDPAVISQQSAKDGKDYADVIARGVAAIDTLGLSYDDVMAQAEQVRYRDRTLARHISEEQADAVRAFLEESELDDLALLHLQATSKRYYPYDTLASHVLGFTGSDGEGLYGLEYEYDSILAGTDGKYIGAKDSSGNELVYDYESYIPAIDGYNITTTIDVYIQAELEEQLEATYLESGGKNRALGIVMDTETGAVLAMAVYPPYDLNNPRELNFECADKHAAAMAELETCPYAEKSEEFAAFAMELYCSVMEVDASKVSYTFATKDDFSQALKQELMLETWSNKAINELYMPGSTFKVITAAMAYEEDLVIENKTYSCPGYHIVNGQKIKCHYLKGHGDLTFPRGLQQSCNPVLMQMGFEIGADNYRKYFEAFGYFEKSGIDISGESVTTKGVTFWDDETFESAEVYLATASFGQNFKISPIAHLTAITAVANGGDLLTPHFIKEITDSEGNVIYTYEPKVRRQVISEETSKEVSKVLADGVATDGGSNNAYIAGYRIAAKTGTSEKKDEKSTDYEKYVCSAIAYAPYEAPKLSAIILVDEPTEGVLYASVIAAPYIGALMEEILPYYGVAAEYTEEELKTQTISAPALVQGRVAFVKGFAESLGFEVEVIGDGEYVKAQSPATGEEVEPGSAKIILYTTDEAVKAQKQIKVPDLVGMTAVAANGTLINNGLNIKISGAKNYMYGKGAIVVEQSPAAGEYVKEGSVVNITLRYMDAVD